MVVGRRHARIGGGALEGRDRTSWIGEDREQILREDLDESIDFVERRTIGGQIGRSSSTNHTWTNSSIGPFAVVVGQQPRTEWNEFTGIDGDAEFFFDLAHPVAGTFPGGEVSGDGEVELEGKSHFEGAPSLQYDRTGRRSEHEAVEHLMPESVRMNLVAGSGVEHRTGGGTHHVELLHAFRLDLVVQSLAESQLFTSSEPTRGEPSTLISRQIVLWSPSFQPSTHRADSR